MRWKTYRNICCAPAKWCRVYILLPPAIELFASGLRGPVAPPVARQAAVLARQLVDRGVAPVHVLAGNRCVRWRVAGILVGSHAEASVVQR